jgi:hypothetical protein
MKLKKYLHPIILLDQIGPLSGHFVKSMEKTILNCLDMKGIARGKVLFKEKIDINITRSDIGVYISRLNVSIYMS